MSNPDEQTLGPDEQTLDKMAFAVKWRREHPTGIAGWLSLDDVDWQRACRQIERREAQRSEAEQ